jgi:aminopeptidase N
LSLGDALPTVVPWENGGWAYYPYSQLGDHGHYATSTYSVEIKSSGTERLVVGGTGHIAASQPQTASWKFSAENVRDVAYVVSPRFINPLGDASMIRKVGKTTMLAYFLPEHRADGQRQLDLVAPALAWFEKQIGPYPFESYMVGEMGVPLESTDNYAQEYPMAYFVPTSWLRLGTAPGNWTWYIPVHEVGHQWFYSTVGNNQLTDPWLDEAITTYITAEYVRATFPEHYARSWASMSGGATTSRPVSSGVYSGLTSENQYTSTVYDTGVVMLNKVRVAMGDAAFYNALKDYYSTFKFKRAAPSDLLITLQKHSKADLTAIFTQYLGY